MARPKFTPTQSQRDMVRVLSGMQVPHEQIRLVIKQSDGKPITAKTLRKAFRGELDEGAATVHATAVGRMMRHMNSRNERISFEAVKFYLQTQHGWKVASAHELTGRNGGPIESADVSAMTKEEKAAAFARAICMQYQTADRLPPELKDAIAEAMAAGDDDGTADKG